MHGFGDRFETSIKTNALGMEIGTQHKYNFDLLVDFRENRRCGRE